MTDLASQRALTRSAPHLPLSWYFDPKVAEAEQRLLFARGPGYVGHEHMARNPGDYRVLDWKSGGAWSLINNAGRHDWSPMSPPPPGDHARRRRQPAGRHHTCLRFPLELQHEGKHIGAPSSPKRRASTCRART